VAEFIDRARRLIARHLATISETFFVYNHWVGLLGVVVLAVASPRLASSALVCSVLARLTAERAAAPRAFLETGLVELNGWFLGLACGTFFRVGPGLFASVVLGAALVAAFSIAMQRVVAAWDLPLTVAPYVPAFWVLWSALSTLPWGRAAELPHVPPAPASALLLVVLGGLRGVGQIFFLPNVWVGVGIAVAVSIADRRLGAAMIAASMAAAVVGYFAGVERWQVEQGLAGFTPAMVAAAAMRGFRGMDRLAVAIAVVTSPFLEAAALRMAGAVGVHALSVSYVGFVWTYALLRPVHEVTAARTSWSTTGARPRLFESG